MKPIAILLLALVLCVHTAAQEAPSMGEYSSMSMEFGSFKANINSGNVEQLSGGVKITLTSDNPEVKPLPIEASSMTFNWPEGASTPEAIIMDGNVRIDHPQGAVRAEHAEWDFNAGTLVLTGSPVMSSEMFKEMRGSRMTINFETGALEVTGSGNQRGSVSELQLNAAGRNGGAEAEASPHQLSADDVTDWAGLIETLKQQARTEGASPGKQIMAQLDRQTQSALANMPSADLAKDPSLLVKQFNGVLRQPGLYSAEAWEGVTLSAEAQALLQQEERSAEQQIQLNRLLLQAAYPNFIKP